MNYLRFCQHLEWYRCFNHPREKTCSSLLISTFSFSFWIHYFLQIHISLFLESIFSILSSVSCFFLSQSHPSLISFSLISHFSLFFWLTSFQWETKLKNHLLIEKISHHHHSHFVNLQPPLKKILSTYLICFYPFLFLFVFFYSTFYYFICFVSL